MTTERLDEQPKTRRLFMIGWAVACLTACATIGYLFVLLSATSTPDPEGKIEKQTEDRPAEAHDNPPPIALEAVTAASGIVFEHFPATRQSLLPEDMGSGLAWGDYDGDGDPDLFLVNFCGPILEPIPLNARQGRCALYRNDGDGRFRNVSTSVGLDVTCFGMAGAWGDYDNDADLDLYVTCYGSNLLYRNEGDGTFTNVTKAAGVGDERFSAGCGWGDYDRDGDIDLYVCNYVKFMYRAADAKRTMRQYGSEVPFTMNPSAYKAEANVLYRNNGDGTFTDVAALAGVADTAGRSLVAAWFDFDNDGWSDLYVANDLSDNGVFRHRGDGPFEDIGASSLGADSRGAMGLAVGDYDHDGDFDLFITNWVGQENAFFENALLADAKQDAGRGRLIFMDVAQMVGVGHVSLNVVGWATGFVDFDNDGHRDLWVVNGHTFGEVGDHTRLRAQRVHLFRQQSAEGFVEMAQEACPELSRPIVGRGGAHADYDLDGRVDLAIMVHGGQPILLRNVSQGTGHWITLRLRQHGQNTHALGARIVLRTGDQVQSAQVGADAPYLSQSHTDVHFGLGSAGRIDELTIHWPDGHQETHDVVSPDGIHTFTHTPNYKVVAPRQSKQRH